VGYPARATSRVAPEIAKRGRLAGNASFSVASLAAEPL